MTREIVLDTETTGLSPAKGDRIVELACVELEQKIPTGKVLHHYVNPGIAMPAEAFAIHGISDAMLHGKPDFAAIAANLLEFVAGAPLVIHNAEFDLAFLNAELRLARKPVFAASHTIIDTLILAREKFPNLRNDLDSLCQRFVIDLAKREKHGALVDAHLLAEVYLQLTGGRQTELNLAELNLAELNLAELNAAELNAAKGAARIAAPPAAIVSRLISLTAAEEEEARALIKRLQRSGKSVLWQDYGAGKTNLEDG